MPTWFWLPGRKARQALAAGRPDHARELLEPHLVRGHKKALALLPEVADGFHRRAARHLSNDNPEAAWDDLLACEKANAAHPDAAELRTTLTKLAAATCRAAFMAGNLEYVRACVARFQQRAAAHPAFEWLSDAATHCQAARDFADEGDFAAALGLIERTRDRLPVEAAEGLSHARDEFVTRHEKARTATQNLFVAVENKDWSEVHRCAADLLAVAPEHREARQLQTEAWNRLAMPESPPLNGIPPASTTDGRSGLAAPASPVPRFSMARTRTNVPAVEPLSDRPIGTPKRLWLALDGVGMFLLLLQPRITIGADANPGPIDVPVTANLQRIHTQLVRDEEGGYLIEPSADAAVAVNGEPVTGRRVLKSGDELLLGPSCRLGFSIPNPVSGTAVLTPRSVHRLAGHATAVVLVASNLLVGPDDDSHVCVPRADTGLAFYTTTDGLGVRAEGRIRVQSIEFQNNAGLPVPCEVDTADFRFRLSVYDPRS